MPFPPTGLGLRRRPRVAALLMLVMLIPVTALAVFTGSSAVSSWSDRQDAISVQRDSARLGAMMAARVAVTDEDVATSAIVEAAQFKLTPAKVKALFGIDYVAQLKRARPRVDASAALYDSAILTADVRRLQGLRSRIDAGRVTPTAVLALFSRFISDIDAQWRLKFDRLRDDILTAPSGNGMLSSRVTATSTVFAALDTAKRRLITCGDAMKHVVVPADVETLIAANGAFAALTAGFSADLGPHAALAWRTWQHDRAAKAWERTVAQTVAYALAGRPSPLAANALACGQAFINEPFWLNDLTAVAQGAAADMRDVARHQEIAATGSYLFDGGIFVLSLLLGVGASFLLARAVVRPLRRLALTAHEVAGGNFTLPAVPPAGPREVADTIQAVNDLTAVLSAVEAFTVTLAEDPAAASLDVPLPGRTGRALQATLSRLRQSVLDTEQQRSILEEVATHDSLTGLLNRRAARVAVEAELTRARREGGAIMAMFVDLDGLKRINDTHGHSAGDEAISLTAHALRSAARECDVVARIGGDEFLIAGRAPSDDAGLLALADRLDHAVTSSVVPTASGPVPLHCSIGISLSEATDDVDSLVAKADRALYREKQRGRDQQMTGQMSTSASGRRGEDGAAAPYPTRRTI
jgi:diguanylate cyclase (GGDEF)-like protein